MIVKRNEEQAFKEIFKKDTARIVLKLGYILCEVENSAPDFISVEKDELSLRISVPEKTGLHIFEFDQDYKLNFKGDDEATGFSRFELEEDCIWFDIGIDQIKDIWVADLEFSIVSKNSRYLAYYLKELNHQFEWLQPDMGSGEIKVMSITKKKFKPPVISGKESYSAFEVLRCADMIGRAVRKIDLRTRAAYVKFNTEKGRLEPLIISMGDKLGFKIEALPKDKIAEIEESGESVSHTIHLKPL